MRRASSDCLALMETGNGSRAIRVDDHYSIMYGSSHNVEGPFPLAGRSLIGDHELAEGDMEPIIAGRDLRKSWGATLVLEHADFLLHAGDKVALVGPNVSGKSTLARLPQ